MKISIITVNVRDPLSLPSGNFQKSFKSPAAQRSRKPKKQNHSGIKKVLLIFLKENPKCMKYFT